MWFFLLNRPDCCSCVTSPLHVLPIPSPSCLEETPQFSPLPCRPGPGRWEGCHSQVPGRAEKCLARPWVQPTASWPSIVCLFPTQCTCLLVILFCCSGKNNILFCFLREMQHECAERTQKGVGCKCTKHVQLCVCIHIYMVSIYIVQLGWSQQRCVCLYEMFEKR